VKTISLKKVAVVAVASLAIGTFTAIAPANAAARAVDATSVAAATASVAVGSAASTVVSASLGAATSNNAADTAYLTVSVTQRPADSTVSFTDNDGAGGAGTVIMTNTGNAAGFDDANSAQSTVNNLGMFTATTVANTVIAAADSSAFGTISIVPDKPGIYVITVQGNVVGNDTPVAGTASTFTVYAGYSASAAYPNTAFPTQGSNISTGWAASNPGQSTVRFTNFSTSTTVKYYVTASGASIASYTEQEAGGTAAGDTLSAFTNSNNTNLADGFNFTSASSQSGDAVDVVLTPNTGVTSATVTVKYFNATTGAETIFSTATVTYGAAVALSAGTSTSVLGSGTGNPAVAGTDDVVSADATVGTQRANVLVTLKDQYANPVYGKTLSATISGPGLILWNQATQATQGTVRADSIVLTASQNTAYLGINGDGQGGVATITISVGSTVISTETVTFFGTAKTLKAVAFEPHIVVGANADALEVLALDANGNAANFTVTALSDAIGYVSSTVSNCAKATAGEVALGYTKNAYYCDVQGVAVGTANLTVAPGSTTTNSPAVAFRVTKSVAYSVELSTDKATYKPGEKITLTVTAKDQDGYLLGAGAYGLLDAANTVSQSLTGTAFAANGADITVSAGKATTTYYAPLVTGPFTFSATIDATDTDVAAAIRGTKITATATVVDANQTSILTQIDALNAKIVALNALIAKIMKKLGVK